MINQCRWVCDKLGQIPPHNATFLSVFYTCGAHRAGMMMGLPQIDYHLTGTTCILQVQCFAQRQGFQIIYSQLLFSLGTKLSLNQRVRKELELVYSPIPSQPPWVEICEVHSLVKGKELENIFVLQFHTEPLPSSVRRSSGRKQRWDFSVFNTRVRRKLFFSAHINCNNLIT